VAQPLLVHATTVAIGGRAMLLRGPSGSGKSDLALRLIDAGARLVADDQSELSCDGGAVLVRAPDAIAGLIELRGVGVLRLDPLPIARLALVVDLVPPEAVERMPDQMTVEFFGVPIPLVALAPFEASATAKLRFVLSSLRGDGAVHRLAR
jgi:HPr kinase/phosphorylase